MPGPERKLYLGGRVRRLRRELGLNQSAMAAEIGISPSYLNHLERNQRPVTAQVLLRLAEVYNVDLRTFARDGRPPPKANKSAPGPSARTGRTGRASSSSPRSSPTRCSPISASPATNCS